MPKAFKIVLIGMVILAGLILLSFIPVLQLKTAGMAALEQEHFTIYYEKQDENAAADIAGRLQKGYDRISQSIRLRSDYKTEVYIYGTQKELHMKKYGLLGLLFGPDWYIGDNIGNKVIIVSPNSPGKQHDYESVADAALHEYVHTLMWSLNPKLSKFLNEGMAGYVSGNTRPQYKFNRLPKYEDTKISNPITFGNSGLYPLSYTYIEFLDKTYGMSKTLELMRAQDYKAVLGKSDRKVFDDWLKYIKKNYSNI